MLFKDNVLAGCVAINLSFYGKVANFENMVSVHCTTSDWYTNGFI